MKLLKKESNATSINPNLLYRHLNVVFLFFKQIYLLPLKFCEVRCIAVNWVVTQYKHKFIFRSIHLKNIFFDLYIPIDILRQRTRDVEVKRYCVGLLEKFGSFAYTRKVLEQLDNEAREEIAVLGGNPLLESLLDDLLKWKEQ